jgi:hypothetical protein
VLSDGPARAPTFFNKSGKEMGRTLRGAVVSGCRARHPERRMRDISSIGEHPSTA